MREDWKYQPLGEICDLLNGFAFKSNMYVNEGIRVIRIANVQKGYIEDSAPAFYPFSYEDELSRYMLQEGDLLMSLTGNVGRVGILNKEMLPAALNQRVACIRLKKKDVLLKYLFHYFNSDYFEKMCIASSHGAAQLNMSTVWLAKHSIPVPPLSEQERIVALLDDQFAKIDALKANAASQLQAAKDLFQSALKEMLTPKEGWERKTLEEISTDMYRGSGITRDQITEDGISCVRYGEIYTTYNYWFDNCKSHTIESKIKSPKYFEKGDILFTITGESVEDIAKSVAYLGSEKCLAGGDIVVMKHNQNAKYLSYALSTPDAIKQKGLGKTKLKVVHSNVPSIKSIAIPIPSLPEQERIAARLDAISDKVARLQENYNMTLTLCNDLKQSLLKSIFA